MVLVATDKVPVRLADAAHRVGVRTILDGDSGQRIAVRVAIDIQANPVACDDIVRTAGAVDLDAQPQIGGNDIAFQQVGISV